MSKKIELICDKIIKGTNKQWEQLQVTGSEISNSSNAHATDDCNN